MTKSIFLQIILTLVCSIYAQISNAQVIDPCALLISSERATLAIPEGARESRKESDSPFGRYVSCDYFTSPSTLSSSPEFLTATISMVTLRKEKSKELIDRLVKEKEEESLTAHEEAGTYFSGNVRCDVKKSGNFVIVSCVGYVDDTMVTFLMPHKLPVNIGVPKSEMNVVKGVLLRFSEKS